MSDDLPAHVSAFIGAYIDSVEQLEILLLLAREPNRAWTVAGLAGAIASSAYALELRLGSLCSNRLVRRDGEDYVYAPEHPSLAATVDELAREYKARRLRVIDAIFAR